MTFGTFNSLIQPVAFGTLEMYYSLKRASRYTPFIKDMTRGHVAEYAIILTEDVKGLTFNVYNTFRGKMPYPLCIANERILFFSSLWLLKGFFKLYQPVISEDKDETIHCNSDLDNRFQLLATIKSSSHKSSIRFVRGSTDIPASLGYHNVMKKVDSWDNYRQFSLEDGSIYQWTCKGKWLERVSNLGQKESEVRERIAEAELHGSEGFTIRVNEKKISREIAISTALTSFLEQWV